MISKARPVKIIIKETINAKGFTTAFVIPKNNPTIRIIPANIAIKLISKFFI